MLLLRRNARAGIANLHPDQSINLLEALSSILPPSGVNLMALPIRFSKICFKRVDVSRTLSL